MLENMNNFSIMSGFLLFGFSEVRELQMVYFFIFLVLYLGIVTANLLIISAIIFGNYLHHPMYLFLMNLAIQDIGTVSATVPKSMVNMLINTRHISFLGCGSQVFFAVFFLSSDVWLLTVMAYDRYVAICNPLKYETIMNKQSCLYMLLAVWISGFLVGFWNAYFTFAIPFCSNIVSQYFCEIPKLIKISCTGFNQNEITVLLFSFLLALACFVFIFITYISILYAVLKMPSTDGRKKAFSTCLPHLMVVSMYLFSSAFAYLRPPSNNLDLVSTIMYSLIPPLLNPIIYSMRNKSIKVSLSKLLNIGNPSKKTLLIFYL